MSVRLGGTLIRSILINPLKLQTLRSSDHTFLHCLAHGRVHLFMLLFSKWIDIPTREAESRELLLLLINVTLHTLPDGSPR